MSTAPSRSPHSSGHVHVATIAHAGRIWETWLEFEDDPRRPTSHRARLRFEPPTGDEAAPAFTTYLIVEESYDEAVAKARSFDDRVLQGMLRSALPGAGDASQPGL